jgi:hypothetical protein
MLDAERRLLEVQDRVALGRTDANTSLTGMYRAFGRELAYERPILVLGRREVIDGAGASSARGSSRPFSAIFLTWACVTKVPTRPSRFQTFEHT